MDFNPAKLRLSPCWFGTLGPGGIWLFRGFVGDERFVQLCRDYFINHEIVS